MPGILETIFGQPAQGGFLSNFVRSGAASQLGSGLVSSPNFGLGLGAGLAGANTALQGFRQQEERKGNLARLLQGSDLSQQQRELISLLPQDQQNKTLAEQLFPEFNKDQQLLGAIGDPSNPLNAAARVDLGLDPNAGQSLTAQTALRGQDVTLRGQDVTAGTARRGQDITARGQDITQQTALRGQDVTARGQDISADTAANRLSFDQEKQLTDVERNKQLDRLNRAKFRLEEKKAEATSEIDRQRIELRQAELDEKIRQFDNPAPAADPARVRLAEAGGLIPGTTEFNDFVLKDTSPQTTINNNGEAQESAFSKETGKLEAKQFADIRNAAVKTFELEGQLGQIEQALDDGLFTGVGGAANTFANRIGATLGIEGAAEKAQRGELVTAIQNQLALFLRNPDNGGGLPGAASERDVQFLLAGVPGVGRTEAGNRSIISAYRQINQRRQQVAQLAEQHVAQNGSLRGFHSDVIERFGTERQIIESAVEQQRALGGSDPFAVPGGQSVRPQSLDVGQSHDLGGGRSIRRVK